MKLAVALFASAAMAASSEVAQKNIGDVEDTAVPSDKSVGTVAPFFDLTKDLKPTKTASEDIVLPDGKKIRVEMQEFSGPEAKELFEASQEHINRMLKDIFGDAEEIKDIFEMIEQADQAEMLKSDNPTTIEVMESDEEVDSEEEEETGAEDEEEEVDAEEEEETEAEDEETASEEETESVE